MRSYALSFTEKHNINHVLVWNNKKQVWTCGCGKHFTEHQLQRMERQLETQETQAARLEVKAVIRK